MKSGRPLLKIFVTSNPFFFSERKGEETEVTNDFFLINQIIVGTLMEYQPFDFILLEPTKKKGR